LAHCIDKQEQSCKIRIKNTAKKHLENAVISGVIIEYRSNRKPMRVFNVAAGSDIKDA
jgi:hypothetical protein